MRQGGQKTSKGTAAEKSSPTDKAVRNEIGERNGGSAGEATEQKRKWEDRSAPSPFGPPELATGISSRFNAAILNRSNK